MRPSVEAVTAALATVSDPEIHQPLTDLGMIRSVDINDDGSVHVGVWLTVAGCPMKDTINRDVTAAVGKVEGVTSVAVGLQPRSEGQRHQLTSRLRGGRPDTKDIPFAQPGSLTRVYAVASGKGGVGKSSV